MIDVPMGTKSWKIFNKPPQVPLTFSSGVGGFHLKSPVSWRVGIFRLEIQFEKNPISLLGALANQDQEFSECVDFRMADHNFA